MTAAVTLDQLTYNIMNIIGIAIIRRHVYLRLAHYLTHDWSPGDLETFYYSDAVNFLVAAVWSKALIYHLKTLIGEMGSPYQAHTSVNSRRDGLEL